MTPTTGHNINQLEVIYQDLIKNFSPAYLSGSDWYVGPSLKEYLLDKRLNPGLVATLMVVAEKLEKKPQLSTFLN